MDEKGKIAEIQRMIERAQKGDLQAMTVLVEEHQGAVHGFLAQLIGDAAISFCDNCIAGLKPNMERITQSLNK